MKMIVSNYDGTIKRYTRKPNLIQKIDLKKDLKEIKNFIENGNIFTITSQRTTTSLIKELESKKVPYNYFTAFEGLVTFDKDNNLIYSECLDNSLIKGIEELIKKTNLIESLTSYNAFKACENIIIDNPILIAMSVKDIKDTILFLKNINTNLDLYEVFWKKDRLWLHKKINKERGIKLLLNQINMPSEIITIGDSLNDLTMINKYNGWCINKSEIDIYNSGNIKTTPNIRTLIKTLK